jgi:hypothetical protein
LGTRENIQVDWVGTKPDYGSNPNT